MSIYSEPTQTSTFKSSNIVQLETRRERKLRRCPQKIDTLDLQDQTETYLQISRVIDPTLSEDMADIRQSIN